MYMLCRHIKSDGTRCQAPALRNMPYCFFHDHFHREVGKTLKKPKTKKRPIALPRLEDRGSVLTALSDVIGALGAGHLDSSTAGRLIYGLQVAGQFAKENPPEDSPKAVQSFTVAEDGAEIANEFFICEEDDRCEICSRIDYCQIDEAKEFRAARGDKPDADEEDETGQVNDKEDDNDEDDDEEDDNEVNAA
ncbi:MAG: hypothetical protein WBP85_15070 [Terracidiphilus sp.]